MRVRARDVTRERVARRSVTLAASLVAASAAVACSDTPVTTRPPAPSYVAVVLDAPLCSSQLEVQLRIDGSLIGIDTLRVHLPPDRTQSHAFPAAIGRHTLSVRVTNGFVWPDKSVNLSVGTTLLDTLPFYCS